MSLDPATTDISLYHQHNLVAKSSKNAYGCPTVNSAGHPTSSQNLSMMHFDEQSFIRNLLTNDRLLQNNNTNNTHNFQSHDTLPQSSSSIPGQHS